MNFDVELFEKIFVNGLDELGLELGEQEMILMNQFAKLIVETNQTLNLTRLVEPADMAIKNFLDSLSCFLLELPLEAKCLDLGTGAGFPGIPLAICQSQWSFVLLDSLRKRLNFLDQASSELGLTNVETVHMRAEEAGRSKNMREAFDLVVSRAVADLPILLELATPLVKVGGLFIAFKASGAKEELARSSKALKELKVDVEQVFPLQLPLEMGERNLLVFRKIGKTPRAYPRRPGQPARQPLI